MDTPQTTHPFIPSEQLNNYSLTDLLPQPNNAVHLDLGTGLGHFIEAMIARQPQVNWVGLEYDGKILKRAVRRLHRQGSKNVLLFAMEARPFLLECVAPETFDHIWINFPDPWPKKKHANRRHTYPWMLGLLVSRLRLGGELHLATDVPAYLEAMMTGLAALHAVVPTTDARWQRAALDVQTKYERKWLAHGKSIFYGDWRKVAAGPVYPFAWQPAPTFQFTKLPPRTTYKAGRYEAKVFAPHLNAPHQAGFYLIDRETGISTPGTFDAQHGTVLIKGAWTPWKINLLRMLVNQTP